MEDGLTGHLNRGIVSWYSWYGGGYGYQDGWISEGDRVVAA